MSVSSKLLGMVRGVLVDTLYGTNSENEQAHLSGQGDQLFAGASAAYQDDVRQGRAFHVNTGTAVASVIALPTTAVALALYNNEPDGGRSLVIHRVGALFTVDTAIALVHAGIIGNLGQVREAAPTAAAVTIKQSNGMGKLDTRARAIIGGTALPATTGIAANWFPINPSQNTAVITLPGFQITADIDGRIIVPPGRYFALHTLSSVITTSAQMFVWWTEKQLLLG